MSQQWLRDKLFDLASEVQEGCIVELGTFHGAGAILLAQGARAGYGAQVYTIDDFMSRQGWIGEHYGPKDRAVFRSNVRDAGVHVTHIQQDHRATANRWNEPIGMLYWDSGSKARFWKDWVAWNKHILVGGVAVIKDTVYGDLGATVRTPEICATGEYVQEDYNGGVTVLRRAK